MKFALGQAVLRTEDPRLLTGRGRYTDDFVLPRLAHAYVLRSPHAHARIRSVDIRAAQQMPGVLAVLTGEDWAAEIPGSISHGQGHETMYKIVLSHRLGLDEADIRVAHSDTDLAPDGGGTYASRTAVLGGSAASMAADKIVAKARKIAAHAMEGRGRHRIFERDFSRRRHRP